MHRAHRLGMVVATIALVAVACGGTSSPSQSPAGSSGAPSTGPASQSASVVPGPSTDTTPVTITVWDYYGAATPFSQAVLDGFKANYPWITVDYQSLSYNDMQTKYNAGIASGQAPDVGTLDMTWIPTLAANGALADIGPLSAGKINGKSYEEMYTPGAIQAMTFDSQTVTALFDFDTYALYYRSDLFDQKGIAVPKTWDELRAAAKSLATDTNGDGKPDHALYAVRPEVFHFSQFLFQAGGTILGADDSHATFNSDAGVEALKFERSLIDDGSAIYGPDADQTAIVDGRIAMFQDGPYFMGIMKSAAPDLAGKWKVALAPYSKQPGSYLGGTGLSIASSSTHKEAAWLFIQYMLDLPQQIGVFSLAGAAPATTPALNSPELTKPDPYFGGDAPFKVFLESMATSTHFPYVKAWNDIAAAISQANEAALLTGTDPKKALDDAATQADGFLAK